MPHQIVKLAEEVIENSEHYSECVLFHASQIISWNNSRRDKIKKLWQEYRSIYKKIIVITAKTRKEQYLLTSRLLYSLIKNTDTRNNFHECKNVLHDKLSMELSFVTFRAKVKASLHNDINEMHRYMCCVNARRYDDSLDKNVSFLSGISKLELSEILLFRLKNLQNPTSRPKHAGWTW